MKQIKAKIDEYTKDGQTKGKYVDIGVILSNDNGEYILMNPAVDLSGVLMRQRIMAQKNGKKVMDSVACSIFDNSSQAEVQRRATESYKPQPGPIGGANNTGFDDSFEDSIPF